METNINYFKWMKYRKVYLFISVIVITVGIFSLIKFGLNSGVEFTGGTNAEYGINHTFELSSLKLALEEAHLPVNSIQKTSEKSVLIKLGNISTDEQVVIQKVVSQVSGENSELLRFEQVGPSLSGELVKKTGYALILSAALILIWIAYQFKNWKFGLAATIATVHDAMVVVGIYSLLGHFAGAEVDFLFVTALLTILSFSVHDTIIVYDRIREIRRKHGGSISDVSNRAISETMRRSLFNSLTIVIMLVSLIVFGGSSIKFFAASLLIGIVSGTYSSPFVAVSLLVVFEEIQKRRKGL